jgi:alpha-galactosidase
MRQKPIITIIGAASITFGPKLLRDIINHPEVDGCTFRFVDIHEEHLAIYTQLAKHLREFTGRSFHVEADADRKKMLSDSDYVMISVETGHYDFWKKDYTMPRQLGSRQINGELGGPGGMIHAFRQIPLHLDIAQDITALCPKATVMVMSNPLNRICLALARYSQIGEVIGLCHGVEMAEKLYLNKILDMDGNDIEATAAGTNHLTWIIELRRKSTGEDLYPLLAERVKTYDPAFEPLSRKLYDVYGYYSATGDAHMGEYIPYAWEFIDMGESRFEHNKAYDEQRWTYLAKLTSGEIAFSVRPEKEDVSTELRLIDFLSPRSWVDTLSIPIIAAALSNKVHRMPALNLLNTGQIENLARDVFVETPGIVDATGVRPVHMGCLPKPLAAFCQRDIDQTELTVEAAVTGDYRTALQAMLLDPVTDSAQSAENILQTMLKEYKAYLPNFT